MMTAVQGIIAAGTAAYLTREATYEKIALTSNHLFYLVGIAFHAAAVESPHFSLAAKAVFMMTPIALVAHLFQDQASTPKAIGDYFNRLYYATGVVSTLVLVVFGHTAYGVGFFSVMALDFISRSEKVNEYIKTAFEWSANGAAVLTFASYAVKLETPTGQCLMGSVVLLVFAPRVCKLIQSRVPNSESSTSKSKSWDKEKSIFPKEMKYSMVPVQVMPNSGQRVMSGPFTQRLKDLTGGLPHDL